MHPSITANFNPPSLLKPLKQMRVNEPCWCGSGKKWKKCHRDRERQKPVPIGKLMAEQRAEMLRGYCLHPEASLSCSLNIIRAHTVQRRGGLAAIAENGHVISTKLGFEDIYKNDGEIVPRELGVRDASTFMGFCRDHDDQLFSPIEKAPIGINKEAAFLLSFRAICYEVFHKDAELRNVEIRRQADKGKSFEKQCVHQQILHAHREGVKQGIKNLESWKDKYDTAYLSKNYEEFSFYSVKFSNALPIVACGAFYPEFDFGGNCLQTITLGEATLELVCFNLTVVNGKSLAVLGWTGEPGGPAEKFFVSFRSLPKDTVANAALHLACEHLENIYFRPSWWNFQSSAAREHLVRRFRSGTLSSIERNSDCLSKLKYVFATADVEEELDS